MTHSFPTRRSSELRRCARRWHGAGRRTWMRSIRPPSFRPPRDRTIGGSMKNPSLKLARLFARTANACIVIAVLVAACLPVATWAQERADDCRIGSYRLDDDSHVDVGTGNGDHLRWRREDGTTGELTGGANDTWTSTLG